jgi:hypothetical protein
MGLTMKSIGLYLGAVIFSFAITGCVNRSGDNEGQMQSYPSPVIEAEWIREGQPIVFGNQKWYPVNDVEILLDSEVYQVGEYKGVQVFVDKIDTKPYRRMYTKFAKNKFRYYEKRND